MMHIMPRIIAVIVVVMMRMIVILMINCHHLQRTCMRHRSLHICRCCSCDCKHGHRIQRIQQRMERLHAHRPVLICQTSHIKSHILHDMLTFLLPAALCLSIVRLRATKRASRLVQSHKCMRKCLATDVMHVFSGMEQCCCAHDVGEHVDVSRHDAKRSIPRSGEYVILRVEKMGKTDERIGT